MTMVHDLDPPHPPTAFSRAGWTASSRNVGPAPDRNTLVTEGSAPMNRILSSGPGLAMTLICLTLGPSPARAEGPVDFQKQVAPLLRKYCADCHGPKVAKGGINVLSASGDAAILQGRKTWKRILDNVEGGAMPPEDKPQPTEAESALIVGYLQSLLSKANCVGPPDPGRVTLRRLNKVEYRNTIRDLVGIDFTPADDFPSDDVGYGFDNIGDVLSLPPLLMERYLAAAESIAAEAIIADDQPHGPAKRFDVAKLTAGNGKGNRRKAERILASSWDVGLDYDLPKSGTYIIRATAFGQRAGSELPKMAFQADGKTLQTVEVKAEEDSPGTYEHRVKLKGGKRLIAVAFVNDFYDPNHPDPKKRDRNLGVDWLEIQGPIPTGPADYPESHKRLIYKQPNKTNKVEVTREILTRLTYRAYRRPPAPEEIDRLLGLVAFAEKNGDKWERGIQLALQAVLVSPHFLFKVEIDPKDNNAYSSRWVNEFELATRLSYFLWSSMPDDQLLAVAASGTMRKGTNLEAQVARMLRDPKSKALVDNFGQQWLQIRNLRNFNPDPKQFPGFDEKLRASMIEETEQFLDHLIREDRSVLDLLDADYTFLDERLAKHYGLKNVQGEYFRKVQIPNGQRGGLITQASILAVTSNPTRTSPVKRGKWILEQLLNTPPPPPPPGVPELAENGKDKKPLTGSLRKRMEAHRANPSCASCHSKMDPLGFGLENYDAVGAWRETDGPDPVDAAGVLPSGQTFRGPKELKAILKGREKDFRLCLTEKLLTYALGRGLEASDQCVVDRVAEALGKNGGKFSALAVDIVKSEPFQQRKLEGSNRP